MTRKAKKLKSLLLALFLLALPSCSYRLGTGEILSQYQTITIPYVAGDDDGLFTAELIRQFTASGAIHVSNCNGQLILEVCLSEPYDENIGFIYARNEKQRLTKKVVSHEGRLKITATVVLKDACTGGILLGPCDIQTFMEFDFEPDLSTFEDHAFSLGQLEMHPLAIDAATPPLYERLAEKIVDYVRHSW